MKLRRGSALTAVALTALALAATATVSTAADATADDAIGTYYPIIKDQRILDTRSGLGAPKAAVGAGKEISLQVAGRAGVPSGVSAVVLNLTGVSPTSSTYLTAYPSGTTRPTVSSLNLIAGRTRANLVTVPLGADGRIRIYNSLGSVNLLADVMGFYAGTDIQTSHGIGSQYYPDGEPSRLYDSRQDPVGVWYPEEGREFGVDYGTDNPDVRAIAVNITAISPSASGYLMAWDGSGTTYPTSSSVNYTKGQTVPNMVIVPVQHSSDGVPTFVVVNGPGTASTHVAIDVVGAYAVNQSVGLRYTPLEPQRIIDTRKGTGGYQGTLGPATTRTFSAPLATATPETYALVANSTGIAPTASTYLTVWEAGTPKPDVSNLNVTKGESVANATFVSLSVDNSFSVFNAAGSINLAMDVTGRFDVHGAVAPTSFSRDAAGAQRQEAAAEVTRSPIGVSAQPR